MRFWRLGEPTYDSEHERFAINGLLSHPYGLPGVKCESCKQTWGGNRLLPYECPRKLRSHKHLSDRWPIPGVKHRALREKVSKALGRSAPSADDLRPGDEFLPGYLDIPTTPVADFLWSGVGVVLVSERVKKLLSVHAREAVSFLPVTLRKVGTLDLECDPIPDDEDGGRPEDLMRQTTLLSRKSGIGPYYELVVHTQSGPMPGEEIRSTCRACGCEEIADYNRKVIMTPKMWKKHDIFMLGATAYVTVTDAFKALLEKLSPTNLRFVPIPGR